MSIGQQSTAGTLVPRRYVDTHVVLSIGKRLSLLLAGVTVYCVVVGVIVWKYQIPPVDWGSAASLVNTVSLGLLMSFRNRIAYDRWWNGRGLWGQLTNDCRNLAIKCAAFVPADVVSKSNFADTLIAFPEALKRHLRGEQPHLKEMPGFELEQADPAHVPLDIAGRLYAAVADWKRAGHIDGAVLWTLDAHLRGLMDVCGACEKIKNTPLSPSYKGLLRIGLVLNILAGPWLTMPDVGFWGIPIFEIVCFFLLGVELIDSVVEEPFGKEREDLDLDRYCKTIAAGVRANLTNPTR